MCQGCWHSSQFFILSLEEALGFPEAQSAAALFSLFHQKTIAGGGGGREEGEKSAEV